MRALQLGATLLLVACLGLAGCAEEAGPRVGVEPAETPMPETFHRVEPTSLMALPGGMLTELMPSKDPRPSGSPLAKDDPLHDPFLARADARFSALTWHGTNVAGLFPDDAELVRIWKDVRTRPRVSDSRPGPDGRLVVVVELDMAPLYEHLKQTWVLEGGAVVRATEAKPSR